MTLVVQKFGGTSVGTLDHLRRVAAHVGSTQRAGHQVLVTISAMGEQTDDLLAMAQALCKAPPRREVDMLLTAGERISAALLAIALEAEGVAATSLTGSQCGILTDETHGNARITAIRGDRVREALAMGQVVIVAGFQGVSPRTRDITTLGRGGSDLSAIALAAALKADQCQLYKDVPGVLTADPRLVPQARLCRQVSWQAMTELAWAGAAVLHPRGAHLAAKYNIPFEVRSSLDLATPGTLVSGRPRAVESPEIAAIAHKTGMALATTTIAATATQAAPGDLGRLAADLVPKTLAWLWQRGEAPILSRLTPTATGGWELTQVFSDALVTDYQAMLATATATGLTTTSRHRGDLATLTVVGQGFRQSPETLATALAALPAAPLVVDSSDSAICFAVAAAELPRALLALHQALLEAHRD